MNYNSGLNPFMYHPSSMVSDEEKAGIAPTKNNSLSSTGAKYYLSHKNNINHMNFTGAPAGLPTSNSQSNSINTVYSNQLSMVEPLKNGSNSQNYA